MKDKDILLNKSLLITGGTGSFGSAVVKRFIDTGVKEIRIFSRDEKKQEDLRNKYKSEKLKFYIGDVRDYSSINQACKGVDYIFHAAALKQVPSCEFYPLEAVKTNILGTENLLNASFNNSVQHLICLSTDKAVFPINAMGMTKAMMEKLAIAKSKLSDKTIISCTRYGNVMGSRGSVIPLFINQAINNEPITITDENMTRFMMSLEESIDLVLFAFKNGNSGDIFIQKAPASKIGILAEAIIEIFNSKSDIVTIGTRHGEKLFETLATREELGKSIEYEEFYKIKADTRDLNYNKYFIKGDVKTSNRSDYTSHNTQVLEKDELINLLLKQDFIKNYL